MRTIRCLALACMVLSVAACSNNPENHGTSQPIDSTNVNGTAPAAYGGNNPANDEKDSNRNNVGDTGTKANNVHNTPQDQR